jgi:hypothetical protein
MKKLHSHIIIICEGSSEVAYIQQLNRLLRELNATINLCPRKVGTGEYKSVMAEYKAESKNNRRTKVCIWVDYDIYARNEKDCMTNYMNTQSKVPFMFNKQNFEDFMFLHLDDDQLGIWLNTCLAHNHFSKPMHAEEYMPLVQKHFINYKKGDLPFDITLEKIGNLFRHNKNSKIHLRSDFTDFLKKEVFLE